MAAYLFLWNPTKDTKSFTNYKERVRVTNPEHPYRTSWICPSKQPKPGDQVYMKRTGRQNNGLFARGRVIDKPYESDGRRCVKLSLGTLLPLGKEIPASVLQKPLLSATFWNSRASGILIKPESAQELERLWPGAAAELLIGEEAVGLDTTRMKIHPHCLYAAFGKAVQTQGRFVVRRNLKHCVQAFREAQADGARFVVLFADAADDSSTLVSWSVVRSVDSNGSETRVTFGPLHRLPGRKRVSTLQKVADGERISESIRRGQIVCRTPAFVLRALARSDAHREVHALPPEPQTQVPTSAGFGDPEQNRKVEQAAMRIVTEWYQREGWQVTSVEAQRCGFDLLCKRDGAEAHVEVKGAAGNERRFIVTAGELRHATSDDRFVLALVTNALSECYTRKRWPAPQFREQFDFEPIQYWAVSKAKVAASPNKSIETDAKRRRGPSSSR